MGLRSRQGPGAECVYETLRSPSGPGQAPGSSRGQPGQLGVPRGGLDAPVPGLCAALGEQATVRCLGSPLCPAAPGAGHPAPARPGGGGRAAARGPCTGCTGPGVPREDPPAAGEGAGEAGGPGPSARRGCRGRGGSLRPPGPSPRSSGSATARWAPGHPHGTPHYPPSLPHLTEGRRDILGRVTTLSVPPSPPIKRGEDSPSAGGC